MSQADWEKAVAFHGHACPGLAIGVRVCEAAVEKLGLGPALDEELVCVSENDACGVDAVQVLLGCTIGKGNLILKPVGKQAFTFINRDIEKAMRFYLKAHNNGMAREAYMEYLLAAPLNELFDAAAVLAEIPEKARIFASAECEVCGERAAEHKMHLQDGKPVCVSCFKEYDRGW